MSFKLRLLLSVACGVASGLLAYEYVHSTQPTANDVVSSSPKEPKLLLTMRGKRAQQEQCDFEQLVQTHRDAAPITLEFGYHKFALGGQDVGCVIGEKGKVYTYNLYEGATIQLAGQGNTNDYDRALALARSLGYQQLKGRYAGADMGLAVWTVTLDGSNTVLMVTGDFAGELFDPNAAELVELISGWCPAAAVHLEHARQLRKFDDWRCAQPNPKIPLPICQ
jgi:hypothetical protein